jgi:Flp pilus assembly protein TadG
VENRNRNNKRGVISLQFLVIMVPVVLGMMGFALDLGRIYLVRGELNSAAEAMAMAAAEQLNGTLAATDNATAAAMATIDPANGDSNKYNFGSLIVGQGNALLGSAVAIPAYFADAASAIASLPQQSGSNADGTLARHVAVTLNADAPLLFWGLLSLGASRKTNIAAGAVAGVSAPLCQACSIAPFAVQRLDTGDTDSVDFGFVPGVVYTVGASCTGAAPLIAGSTGRINYILIDRSGDPGTTLPEDDYLFAMGAGGLQSSSATPGWSCSMINGTENIWNTTGVSTLSAAPQACAAGAARPAIQDVACGLSTRLTNVTPNACVNVTNLGTVAAQYPVDTDAAFYPAADYSDYAGNSRRLLTVPVVETISATAPMTVVGFRQFLLEPNSDGTTPTFALGDGRFLAMYPNPPIQTGVTSGAVVPVKQGRFDGACGITTGPGKVVLHR